LLRKFSKDWTNWTKPKANQHLISFDNWLKKWLPQTPNCPFFLSIRFHNYGFWFWFGSIGGDILRQTCKLHLVEISDSYLIFGFPILIIIATNYKFISLL
jgi:hypothetical protein